MRHGHPEPDAPYDPNWFAPLELVARELQDSRRIADSFFAVEDFMFMGWFQRTKRSRIMLYKHRDTRRYINVDETGRTYRYVPPKDLDDWEDDGTYRRHRSLRDAVRNLELWLLPWLGHGHEQHRHGLSFDERWARFIALTEDPAEYDDEEFDEGDGDGPFRPEGTGPAREGAPLP